MGTHGMAGQHADSPAYILNVRLLHVRVRSATFALLFFVATPPDVLTHTCVCVYIYIYIEHVRRF